MGFFVLLLLAMLETRTAKANDIFSFKTRPISADSIQNVTHKEYYDNGQLKYEANYKDGKLNGTRKSYYPNGKLQAEGEYINNFPVDTIKEYYPNGQLKREEYYENVYDSNDGNGT